MPRKVDLAGRKIGRWQVVSLHPERDRNRHDLWLCRCDCGTERVVFGHALRRGKSASCGGCTWGGGCTWDEARRETQRETARKRFTTHGLSRSRAYRCWESMLQRCFNPNNPAFADYGGRGITVCDDWRSFVNFYADMGDPPPGLSIHRIDNDGNYEPGNCCWAIPAVQVANRRRRPTNLDNLKKRIASGGPIRRRERNFILDCINFYAPPDDGFARPPF